MCQLSLGGHDCFVVPEVLDLRGPYCEGRETHERRVGARVGIILLRGLSNGFDCRLRLLELPECTVHRALDVEWLREDPLLVPFSYDSDVERVGVLRLGEGVYETHGHLAVVRDLAGVQAERAAARQGHAVVHLNFGQLFGRELVERAATVTDERACNAAECMRLRELLCDWQAISPSGSLKPVGHGSVTH